MEKVVATLWEGSVLAGGAIAGAKWLDRNYFFSSNIAADPNFVNGFMYQHWGGIVAVGAAWASTMATNPYIKAGLVGLTIYGILEEARQLFGQSGNPPTPNWGMMGAANPAEADLDAKLKKLAEQHMMGIPQLPMAANLPMASIPNMYGTGVGSIPNQYGTGVGAAWPN